MTSLNLLDEGLIRMRVGKELRSCSLPEVLEALGKEDVESFPGLRPHQHHAWHAFLVQLAAMAQHRAGKEGPLSAKQWKTLLLSLSDGVAEAWCLVVEDLKKPAFLQPPVPEGTLKAFKNEAAGPDEIDILVTAKNHDLKSLRMNRAGADHWTFALLTLQTMEGFSGRMNYGIARMNGGFSSRPCVAYAPSPDWSPRFRRDLRVLGDAREMAVDAGGTQASSGTALLWLAPWDGKKSGAFAACDPFVIEICRRVRLRGTSEALTCHFVGSAAPRLDAGERQGLTGDPWSPVDRKSDPPKSLTVSAEGFTYRLLQRILLSGEFEAGIAGRPEPGDSWLIAQALIRGQGKTDGYFERNLPIPPKARSLLRNVDATKALGAMSKLRIGRTADAKNKVLKPAILNALQGEPDELKFDDSRPEALLQTFDRKIDELFFPALWEDAEAPEEDANRSWEVLLMKIARNVLEEALARLPLPESRRYRAISAAERTFYVSRRKNFPLSLDTERAAS